MVNKRNNSKRNGGSLMDTTAQMVLPHGLEAGLATLGLVALNNASKKGRKMRGGDNSNNGMMTTEEQNEITGMVNNLMKTEHNARKEIIDKVKAICAKLPKEENANANKKNNANANANKKNNANANANMNKKNNNMMNMEMMEEVSNNANMGGRRRRMRGGELLGASLDVAFGGNAGIEGTMAQAGIHGSTGARANIMNLAGSLDASGQGNASLGLQGGRRRRMRGGAMMVECPDGAEPIVQMGVQGDVSASGAARAGPLSASAEGAAGAGAGASLGASGLDASAQGSLSGAADVAAGPATAGVSGEAGAQISGEAGMTGGRRRRNRKNGGAVADAAMELLFPAGLTAGATTFGLLLADQASKRGYVKRATTRAKKMVSRK